MGEARRRGLFERIVFSFMGPPELGDLSTPPPAPAGPPPCARCGQPYEDHVVRDPGLTWTRCPTS